VMRRFAAGALLAIAAAPPFEAIARADRAPVAVLWLGDASTLAEGAAAVEGVSIALGRSPTARPIDSADDRRALVEGGPATQAAQLQARAEREFVELKLAEAAR